MRGLLCKCSLGDSTFSTSDSVAKLLTKRVNDNSVTASERCMLLACLLAKFVAERC